MSNNIDTFLEGLAIFFGAASFLNRAAARNGGRSFGDVVGDTMVQSTEDIKKIPVSVRTVHPRTTKARVGYITKMINKYSEHPQILEMASGVLSKRCGSKWCIPEKDWDAEVEVLYNFVRSQVRYTRDHLKKDRFASPVRTIFQYHIGDCDDLTITLGSLLMAVGYPVKVRIIQTTGNKDFNHIYLRVGVPPMKPMKWVNADPSVNWSLGHQAPKDMVIKWKDMKV